MRLVTYTSRGTTRSGALVGADHVVDLARGFATRAAGGGTHALRALPADMLGVLDLGDEGLDAARSVVAWAQSHLDDAALRDAGVLWRTDEAGFRLEAPVAEPRTVYAIGLNYRAHAAELGMALPTRPIVFAKVRTCIVGPGEAIEIPHASEQVDWEVELCFVIGKAGRHIAAKDALHHIAGYMNGNDVSVRDWQAHFPTWMMGKGFDTHGPIGPTLVTRDEVPDPHALKMQLWVNNVLKQESSTDDLIFNIPQIIEYISEAVTLQPGDIFFTGTPAGVGMGRTPQEWMKVGDRVKIEIGNLGVLENPVVAEA